jgi:hypothetical protein
MLILWLALIIFVLESSLLKIFSSFIPALIILACLLSFFGFLLNKSKSYKERINVFSVVVSSFFVTLFTRFITCLTARLCFFLLNSHTNDCRQPKRLKPNF